MRKLLFLIFVFSPLIVSAEKLVACHDGDTCRFARDKQILKVRFSGMDAPEIDQPFGAEAREGLVEILSSGPVTLKCDGQHHSRLTCVVFVAGRDVQREMIRAGLAFDFPQHSGGVYKEDQEYAKKNKLGMWSQEQIYSPFCWRWQESEECKANPLFEK